MRSELSLIKHDHDELREEVNNLQQYNPRENVEILSVYQKDDNNLIEFDVECLVEPSDLVPCNGVTHQSIAYRKPSSIVVRFASRLKK